VNCVTYIWESVSWNQIWFPQASPLSPLETTTRFSPASPVFSESHRNCSRVPFQLVRGNYCPLQPSQSRGNYCLVQPIQSHRRLYPASPATALSVSRSDSNTKKKSDFFVLISLFMWTVFHEVKCCYHKLVPSFSSCGNCHQVQPS